MILAMAAAASSFLSYDCVLEVPKRIERAGKTAAVNAIQFPGIAEDSWRFRISIDEHADEMTANVEWPANPMQIAGKFAALSTGKGAYAFATYAGGPCLFTETGCMSLINLTKQVDGTAKLIVTPVALATDRESDRREPFIVVAEGRCTAAGDRK